MSNSVADLAELEATVLRMETGLSALQSVQVAELMQFYGQLRLRFEADLSASPRDVALAKASALMLVQAVAKAQHAA